MNKQQQANAEMLDRGLGAYLETDPTTWDPRMIVAICKRFNDIKEANMGQPGSAQADLLKNVSRAIDEKRLPRLADDEEAA